MKKNINVYLTDVLRAAADIQTYTIDADKEDFLVDRMLQDAVIYKVAVIGEAVRRIPLSLRSAHKQIPWKKIIGMRNIVIHDYADVDKDIVWEVIKKDLPKLISVTQKMLTRKTRSRQEGAQIQ